MRTESDNGFSNFFRMPHTSYGFAGNDKGPTLQGLESPLLAWAFEYTLDRRH